MSQLWCEKHNYPLKATAGNRHQEQSAVRSVETFGQRRTCKKQSEHHQSNGSGRLGGHTW